MRRFGVDFPAEFQPAVTPVDEHCAHCGLTIQRGQAGFVDGYTVWHRHCLLAALLTPAAPPTFDSVSI